MKDHAENTSYMPGFYGKKRMNAEQWANAHIDKWHREHDAKPSKAPSPICHPMVCISRQIGVGALEIADILAELIGYRVVDREIIEHMAKDTKLSEKIIDTFDERYPGWAGEFFTMLTSEKTFLKSDYARQLVRTVVALAESGPTIFVGRGTHMILPRQTLLSVHLVSSYEYRVNRLAKILNLPVQEMSKKLKIIDSEQEDFFKRVYNIKQISQDDFDLVINRDHLQDAGQIARILAAAMKEKFNIETADQDGSPKKE